MDNQQNINFKNIELLALDFDGIMTDGCVYVDQDGRESVKCSRRDGLGIEMLKQAGVHIIVISKEANSVVSQRCNKLKIECYQQIENGEKKLEVLKRFIDEKNIALENVAYMGDDINDLEVLREVGIAITVKDGHDSILGEVDFVTKAKGGEHAVREVCDKIITAKNNL